MKMCQPHWDALRAAIKVRGMAHLGAQTAEQAHADAVAQLEGEKTQFDPLMAAYWEIGRRDMEVVGLVAMTEDWCPLCSVERSSEGLAQRWIEGCCDDLLRYAAEKGLVKTQ